MNATYKTLNPEQEAAINHGEGPLLIIAGAGTGKTTVVTERIKHLILEKQISPANILALTFTEKAAKEMQERIDIAMPYGYTDMWIATFHAFCDRLLRQHAIHMGLTPGYSMLTETESILFLKDHLFDLQLDYFRPLGNPTKFLQGLLQHFSRLKDEDISPEEYLRYAKEISNKQYSTSNEQESSKLEIQKTLELAHAYKTYEELKAKEGIMDFSDLISNTLRLFRTRPNILKEYQKQFAYILIDEFQDTNFAQNELAILLAGEKRNITVVGDDDQAIYRWRGAALSNMLQFRNHFPNATIITLTKNYRSTSNILDTSYKAIQFNNPDRLEVQEHIDKKLTAERKVTGKPVGFFLGDTVDTEAEMLVEKIISLKKEKQYAFNDFAILVRANDHSQPFIRALERNGIPYQFLGPSHLYQQEEIKDLMSFLKVLYNFDDSSSVYRLLTTPDFGIAASDISALVTYSKKVNYTLYKTLQHVDEVEISDAGKEKVKQILSYLQTCLELVPRESAGKILYTYLEDSGLLKTLLTVTTQQEELRAQNVAKLFERLKAYESQHTDASVYAVVDWIELSMQMGESPLSATIDWSENNAVNILTVHSSKGLEFPVVFITNLVTQRFPSRERHEQIPIPDSLIKEVLPSGDFHLQEERRLFYVAMTRAREYLFLTAANFYGEGKRERKISPFVIESVGQEVVERKQFELKNQKKQLSLIDVFPKTAPKDTPLSTHVVPVTYLSYSQIHTFDICPLHYKLKYLLHIPTPPSASESYGTSIHSALRDFYLLAVQGEHPKIEDIEKILETNWINEGYTSAKHEETAYTAAQHALKTYLELNYTPDTLPIGLEIPFQFSLGNLKVGGRIDRIDRVSETALEIIDYKTGSNIPTEKDIKNNFQLTLYGLAASEIRDPLYHRKPEELLLSLVYVEQNKKFTTVRTREDVEKAKQVLLEKQKEIESSDFLCNHSIFCGNCEYKMLCQTS